MSLWFEAKEFLQHSSAVTMDALHVIAGVVALIIFALLVRRPLSSWLPWLLVLAITLINEASDLWIEQWPTPGRQYGEGARDILLTMFLPTVLLVTVRRLPRLFASAPPPSQPKPDTGEMADSSPEDRGPDGAALKS